VVDEDAAWPDKNPFPLKEEQKWHVRVMPATNQDWDTFLNVVQAYDSGTVLINEHVRATGGEAEGAFIQRAGHNDVLVMFGASPSARELRNGYIVRWTAGAPATAVYLLDLTPAVRWQARVDGGSPKALSVSSQGVARLQVSGKGTHSLQLEAR
jgi:hypothetical protein